MNLSVIVPVFNSADSLPQLVRELEEVLPDAAECFEILLINDCSHDKSWDVICSLATTSKFVKGINLMRNYGQQNALLCGVRHALYETVVTLDDDLQNPPCEIPKLLAKLSEGYDVVYGFGGKQQHGLYRGIASHLTKLVMRKMMGTATAQSLSSFRAFRTDLRQAFDAYHNPYVSLDLLLTWGTTRFAAIPVRHDKRSAGQSNYTFCQLISHAVNLITGFSTVPLKIASLNGFACMLLGLLLMIFVLIRYLIQGGSVPGFPFLACLIVILSGAQLFALGVIGEYLARVHARTLDQPPYVVREQITGPSRSTAQSNLSMQPSQFNDVTRARPDLQIHVQ